MATATTIDQVSTAIPPQNATQTAKRPVGRPKKCRECGMNIDPTQEHECPQAAQDEILSDKLTKADFWTDLANLTDDDWSRHIAYLYRLAPSIDRRSSGRPSNLRKYVTRFDLDDVMHEHGSGAYRVDLTRVDPTSGKSFRIAQHKFDIMNMDHPPRVPPGDWVDDPANAAWKWAVPAIEAAAQGGGYPPGFNVADIMEKADNRALKMV